MNAAERYPRYTRRFTVAELQHPVFDPVHVPAAVLHDLRTVEQDEADYGTAHYFGEDTT